MAARGDVIDVRLAYGSTGLTVRLPASATTVIMPKPRSAAREPTAVLRAAIGHPVAGPPLRDVIAEGQRVAISVCDVTRPQPRELMLGAIMEVLDGVIRPEDVVVLIATGTHRASTTEERRTMLGDDVLSAWRVIDHDARDATGLVDLGMVGDVPVWLAREWVEADIRITTGFVEPTSAGFSGGPKMVAPGLAGLDTTLELHNARRIGDPRATWGVIEGNPVHDAVRAIALATGVDFALDVLLDDEQRITRAFAGEILSMHAAACAEARREAMQAVDEPFDLVITTNSGYPLDQNLYQAVKGMSAAAEVVRPGGTIICAAECRDGLPDDGSYGRLLHAGKSPADLLERIAASPVTIPDQWQVQIQGGSSRRPAYSFEPTACRCRGARCPPRAHPRHRRGGGTVHHRASRGAGLRAAAGAADHPIRGLRASGYQAAASDNRPSQFARVLASAAATTASRRRISWSDRISRSVVVPGSTPAAVRNDVQAADHASGW
jgi:nickel-dependent lactate racemase